MRFLFAFLLMGFAFLSGCYYDSKENLYPTLNNTCNDTINVTYTGTITPILINYCTSCHGGSNPSGNVNLATYAGVKAEAANGNLLNSIKQNGSVPSMPQGGGKLDDCAIAAFSKWIQSGAPNN
jgi:hypothetical protein